MPSAETDLEDPDYRQGVMEDDNSLDPRDIGEEDEHFTDESDVDFNVVQTSSDSQHGGRRMTSRNKRIALLGLLGVIVVLAVVFSGGKDDSSSSTSTNPPVALEEPPPDLDATCSPKALADDGTEPCLENCERAECCDFPANLPLSCLEGNQQKCLVYHSACSHLNADSYDPSTIPSSVPPAPANLAELCTTTSLKTVDGFTGCHEACKHAECCYEQGVGTCTHDECAGYAPCLTLAATDHVHKDITTTVNELCDTTHLETFEGRAACRQACSHALCCFQPDTQDTACLHQDTSFCSQYIKCNELESVQPVEATPQETQLACQDDENVPGHVSLCELVCQKGACCFSDDNGCDQLATEISCGDYEPCRKVFVGGDVNLPVDIDYGDFEDGDDSEEEDVNGNKGGDDEDEVDWSPLSVDKEAIDSVCEANLVEEVAQIPDQPSLCEQVCMVGSCCFDKNVKCDVDDPERFCTIYSACSKLHPDEDAESENPPVDEKAIELACRKDDLEECESLCQQGLCCYAGDVCDVPHPERFCAHFGYCDALDAEDEFDEDDDGMDDDEAMDDDGLDYEEIAGGDDGDEDVDDTWVDALEPGGSGNDEGDETDEDDEIVEIEIVDGKVVGADALHSACNGSSPHCKTLCQQGACCYDDDVQCPVDDEELYCSTFDNYCDKFFLDDDGGEQDEADESWVDDIGGGNEGDNAEDLDDGWVDQIEGGGDQDDEDDNDEIIEITDVNGQIVGEDVLHKACTTGSVKCEVLCKQGACCFEGQCDVPDVGRFCAAFGVCEKYYQGE